MSKKAGGGYGKPPKDHQFKKGQSGCRNGRRGNKPAGPVPAGLGSNAADALAELQGRIAQKDGADISRTAAVTRLVLQSAIGGDGPSQRYLLSLGLKLDELGRKDAEEVMHLYVRKQELDETCHLARLAGLPPPDVIPHPAHVTFEGGEVKVLGPCSRETRAWWEFLKHRIRGCVWVIKNLTERIADLPDVAIPALAFARKTRRHLMRQVPKDWNWREQIYTIGSQEEEILDYARRNQKGKF